MKRFFLGVGAFLIGVYLLSLTYIAFHVYDDTAQKADAIVVLGAQSKYKNTINPCLVARVKKAVTLQKQGLSSHIVMSGGVDRFGEESEAVIMKKLATEEGILSDGIFLEEKSKNTYENLLFTREVLKKNNFRTIIIVSDPYHLPRAGLIARSLGISYTVSPALASPCWGKYTFLGIDYLRDGLALISYILTGKISLL